MMKRFFLIFACFLVLSECIGQGKVLTSQYFQNLPAYSPAFTGANNFLDIRTAFRKQWAGLENSPHTVFLSAYGAIRPNYNTFKRTSLRGSNPGLYRNRGKLPANLKLGVGGYILQNDQGPLTRFESMLNFAVHVRVAEHSYLALGTSTGVSNANINMNEVTVKDPINDLTYQSYLRDGSANTFFNLNASLGLYSPHFYVSYGMMQLMNQLITGNEQVDNEGPATRHNILAGLRLYTGEKVELLPNIFYRFEVNRPSFIDLGLRVRYNRNLTAGLAYRTDDTYIAMLGFTVSDLMTLGYSYEYMTSESNAFDNSSHEIALGFRLFNYSNYTSIW